MSLALHYWMGDVHHCSCRAAVSEMTCVEWDVNLLVYHLSIPVYDRSSSNQISMALYGCNWRWRQVVWITDGGEVAAKSSWFGVRELQSQQPEPRRDWAGSECLSCSRSSVIVIADVAGSDEGMQIPFDLHTERPNSASSGIFKLGTRVMTSHLDGLNSIGHSASHSWSLSKSACRVLVSVTSRIVRYSRQSSAKSEL